MNRKLLTISFLLAAAAVLALAPHPYARQTDETIIAFEQPVQPAAWLHVEVQTSYSWFHQRSKGRAWVTASKNDTTPVKVGKLCLRLQAHDTKDSCAFNSDEVVLSERKRGVQIRRRTAFVTAWAEDPALDTLTVHMEP